MIYIIKFTLCLGAFLAFYHLAMERQKMHQFNRCYLLGAILMSLLIPEFAYSPLNWGSTPVQGALPASVLGLNDAYNPWATILIYLKGYTQVFLVIYLVVCITFAIRFVRNLLGIHQRISRNKRISFDKAELVLLNEEVLPYTFMHYIFINEKEFESQQFRSELLTHELAHVHQKHTIDVLITEVLQIILWFNPLVILLKKAIRLNHEFLADQAVVDTYQNIARYQQLLLNLSRTEFNPVLSSKINYTGIKKRLSIMTTDKAKRKNRLIKLMIVPIVIGVGLVFGERSSLIQDAGDSAQGEITKTLINQPSDQSSSSAHNVSSTQNHDRDGAEHNKGKDGDGAEHHKGQDGDGHDRDGMEHHEGKDVDGHEGDGAEHHKGRDGDGHD